MTPNEHQSNTYTLIITITLTTTTKTTSQSPPVMGLTHRCTRAAQISEQSSVVISNRGH